MNANELNPVSLLVGVIARNWWLILVRGLAAIAFGILCFVWPALSLLVLAGVISIFFGLLLAFYPGAGALSLVWLIGAFAVVFGTVAVALALHLRSLPQRMLPQHEEEELVGVAGGERTRDEHTH